MQKSRVAEIFVSFSSFLQVSVSHRTLEEENSERLMLKYYEYLLRIKTMLHDKYSLDVLYNLEQFPIETDESLNEYYLKIVQKVDEYKNHQKICINMIVLHSKYKTIFVIIKYIMK